MLMQDFEERCAYSMIHVNGIGKSQMHIDHHDPLKKASSPYSNLFPAYSICNMAKRRRPNAEDFRKGLRLLNPCKEVDYGEQIFEDPVTHHVIGVNAVAKFHIDILDLNNPALVNNRKERSTILELLSRPLGIKDGTAISDPGLASVVSSFAQLLKYKIPSIAEPPVD